MKIAIASCLTKPEPDVDEGPLVEALRKLDVDAEVAAWDDADVNWSLFSLVVIRSTWNYIERPAAFVAWVEATAEAAPLMNPADIVLANIDKRYLVDLARRDIPTVPTAIFEQDDARTLSVELSERGWSDVVIKPVFGAGSFATRRFTSGAAPEAAHFLAQQLAERAMMVQPYQRAVDGTGERALVWIDGQFSHAIRKTPRFDGDDESVSEALPIADDERALAEAALAPHRDRLLYGRVDVVRDDAGQPRVMELELVEPSLFLTQKPEAVQRFAHAIATHAKTGGR